MPTLKGITTPSRVFGFGVLFLGFLAFSLAPLRSLSAQDSAASQFSPDERAGIEEVIREYLIDHPEIIVEALENLEEKRRIAEQARQKTLISELRKELESDPASPVVGSPDAKVVLVEFFDYRCPYCRRIVPHLRQVLDENDDVKIVMKEYPILSQESIEGARAALAAEMQGKYEAFHFALMENPGDMTTDHILATAHQVGLDTDQLQQDMRSPKIDAALRRNFELGEQLGIGGTPSLIAGNELIPGAVDLEMLRDLISRVREAAS